MVNFSAIAKDFINIPFFGITSARNLSIEVDNQQAELNDVNITIYSSNPLLTNTNPNLTIDGITISGVTAGNNTVTLLVVKIVDAGDKKGLPGRYAMIVQLTYTADTVNNTTQIRAYSAVVLGYYSITGYGFSQMITTIFPPLSCSLLKDSFQDLLTVIVNTAASYGNNTMDAQTMKLLLEVPNAFYDIDDIISSNDCTEPDPCQAPSTTTPNLITLLKDVMNNLKALINNITPVGLTDDSSNKLVNVVYNNLIVQYKVNTLLGRIKRIAYCFKNCNFDFNKDELPCEEKCFPAGKTVAKTTTHTEDSIDTKLNVLEKTIDEMIKSRLKSIKTKRK